MCSASSIRHLELRVVTYEPVSKCPPNFMAMKSKFKTAVSLKGVSKLEELEQHPLSLSFFIFHFSSTYSVGSVQFSSVTQSCPTLCDLMNHSTPGLPVHHQLPEFTQTHVHRVGDIIQPSHSLSSPYPPAPNPSLHQSLFQWVNSSNEVARVLEFKLQHQSFHWTPRTDLL